MPWSPHELRRAMLGVLLAALGSACTDAGVPEDTRPSILLVVIDTLRADAVSAYGEVEGTTPNLDALAREGLLFTRAYAPAPWTVPSHATLLTGLPVSRHRVGLGGRLSLPEDVTTVAERLSAAGYQTAGFSENYLVSDDYRMAQGFDHFESTTTPQVLLGAGSVGRLGLLENVVKVAWQGVSRAVLGPDGRLAALVDAAVWAAEGLHAAVWPGGDRFDPLASLEGFARNRDADRPFFVFVNLMDAHEPYEPRGRNPFVHPGALLALPRGAERQVARSICDRLPSERAIQALHGLYLGEVALADAKLGAIRRILADAKNLVTVVTSDHGEHFGERRLMNHLFSVGEAVLRVPLVVHGAPGIVSGLQRTPVGLADLAPTLLAWAGVEPASDLVGRPLPSTPEARPPPRPLFAVYDDAALRSPSPLANAWAFGDAAGRSRRAGCGDEDRVFGPMAALTRYPFKLVWYERYPAQLFDLSRDPEERHDLLDEQAELADRLTREVDGFVDALDLDAAEGLPVLSPEAAEALRGLGYVE